MSLFIRFFAFVLLFCTISTSAQLPDSCYQDPSCQHTKQMLHTARQQWDNAPIGINSNARSEQIDIQNYSIRLDMRKIKQQQMKGSCTITLIAKQDHIKALQLDLLQLQVDSIHYNSKKIAFDYNDTIIDIRLSQAIATQTPTAVTVYYQGSPQKDKSWGGFYIQDDYAFNMGVGFASDPHSYGRVWHPCFDNFAEKATYDFEIITIPTQNAQCNGILVSRTQKPNQTISKWKLEQPIPSYLACIAIADYVTVKQNYAGAYGNIPIALAAKASDTTALLQSFEHLQAAITTYEYWYGKHRFDKVGYSLVPFRAGAMEHATNIAYPIYAANGSLRWESLMAHELGHSWWGNNVTCQTAEDMWINEGMASYSVHLFYEQVYGRAKYLEAVQKDHIRTMLTAHEEEGGYRPISGVPFEHTYGSHVYKKGAVVAHNLRGYLGDSLFRIGLQSLQENYQFGSLNSAQFREGMSAATGVDLTHFFDDWVFTGGYPDFSLSAATLSGNTVQLQIHQGLLGRKTAHQKVPLQVTCWSQDWQSYTTTIVADSITDTTLTLPFEPVAVIPNQYHTLNQGSIDWEQKITHKDSINPFTNELGIASLTIATLPDSALLHIKYHLTKAPFADLIGYRADSTGFWTVNGILPEGLVATIGFQVSEGDKNLLYRAFGDTTWQLAVLSDSTNTAVLKNGIYCWASAKTITIRCFGNPMPIISYETIKRKHFLKINTLLSEEVICVCYYTKAGKLLHSKQLELFYDETTILKVPKSIKKLKIGSVDGEEVYFKLKSTTTKVRKKGKKIP